MKRPRLLIGWLFVFLTGCTATGCDMVAGFVGGAADGLGNVYEDDSDYDSDYDSGRRPVSGAPVGEFIKLRCTKAGDAPEGFDFDCSNCDVFTEATRSVYPCKHCYCTTR